MRQQVLLNWQANNTFGWGLLGVGIGLHWAGDPEIQALMGMPMGPNDFHATDPIRALALQQMAPASNQFVAELARGDVDLRHRRILLVDGMGNGFMRATPERHGFRNVGRCIFEDTRIGDLTARLAKYDDLLCASHWNAGLLRAAVSTPVTMIHEGIDHSQFFPGPRSGLLNPGRFYVFSGGKIEFRKAHDLVLLAFREFAARHDDAVLVGSWHSPWPKLAAGFRGNLTAPLGYNAEGGLDIPRWVAENGIPLRQFIELPRTPNPLMPAVLREMDCAIQVSRCEPCTNLPAMEAMACGVPVVLADNTGMRDLVDADNCLPLRSQRDVTADCGTDGWGESHVDEIVAALETLYTDSSRRKRIGARGAEWIVERRRTWRDHASALKTHLLGLVVG